jgi:DNA processing protein
LSADLAYGLSGHGFDIVSGGAYGIDAAAHRAALAAGGSTVIVSAGGLDRPYPSGNAQLFERAADNGLLISESPPGSAPHRQRFLTRNRLIAALSTGVVVVEAARRSGALNTAGHCRLLGRPLMVVPGPVTSAMSAGCHDLLRDEHGYAVLVDDPLITSWP